MRFNLDLSVIETVLKTAGFKVEAALSMPALLKKPVQRDTTFVLPLDELANNDEAITGYDVSQYSPEQFAVVGVFRASGSSSGTGAKNQLLKWREEVKEALVGLVIGTFEPITFQAGRLIEVNQSTQNAVYQLQFQTAHNVVTPVKRLES